MQTIRDDSRDSGSKDAGRSGVQNTSTSAMSFSSLLRSRIAAPAMRRAFSKHSSGAHYDPNPPVSFTKVVVIASVLGSVAAGAWKVQSALPKFSRSVVTTCAHSLQTRHIRTIDIIIAMSLLILRLGVLFSFSQTYHWSLMKAVDTYYNELAKEQRSA